MSGTDPTGATARGAEERQRERPNAPPCISIKGQPTHTKNCAYSRTSLRGTPTARCQQLTGADVCALYELRSEDNVLRLAERTRSAAAPTADGGVSIDAVIEEEDAADADGEEVHITSRSGPPCSSAD